MPPFELGSFSIGNTACSDCFDNRIPLFDPGRRPKLVVIDDQGQSVFFQAMRDDTRVSFFVWTAALLGMMGLGWWSLMQLQSRSAQSRRARRRCSAHRRSPCCWSTRWTAPSSTPMPPHRHFRIHRLGTGPAGRSGRPGDACMPRVDPGGQAAIAGDHAAAWQSRTASDHHRDHIAARREGACWSSPSSTIRRTRRSGAPNRGGKENPNPPVGPRVPFLPQMSHEIRTPQWHHRIHSRPRADTLSEEQREHLDLIDLSARNLLGVIEEILDFSRIEARQVLSARSGCRTPRPSR